MASNYTEHLNLCQWVAEDAVLREDFNADNHKIEAAITAKCEVHVGTYTGDGTETREINLGFQPKFVMVWQDGVVELFQHYDSYSALAIPGHPYVQEGVTALAITDTGFCVAYKTKFGSSNYDVFTNTADAVYNYLILV